MIHTDGKRTIAQRPAQQPETCSYSALHMINGVPATPRIEAPALRDKYPDGVPACNACATFYNNMGDK